MDYPYVDIHTHDCTVKPDVLRVCSYLIGRQESVPDGLFAAGIHPWDADHAAGTLTDFFTLPPENMVAVGETGLDFALHDTDKEKQKAWFRGQLAVAERLEIPVIIHCVKAYNEVVAELSQYKLKAVVFHGFIGSVQLAGELLKKGFYLSFGERSLQSPKTVEVLKNSPAGRMFLETDDAAMDIRLLYTQVALLRGISCEELKKELYINYDRIIKHE